MNLKNYIFILCLFSFLNAQKVQGQVGLGGAGSFNWIHGGIGGELRVNVALSEKWHIVPQFNYSSITTLNVLVNEWYVGTNIQYAFFHLGNWRLDGLSGVYFCHWPNYQNFNSKVAQLNCIFRPLKMRLS